MHSLARTIFGYSSIAVLVTSLMVITGCATVAPITRPFKDSTPDFATLPEASMRAVAMEIEQAVLAGNRELKLVNRDGIVLESPEIQQALRTRAARSELVRDFLDRGHAWERRDGRLWIIRTSAYKKAGTKQSRDIDAMLVNSENRDRWTLYETIVKMNNFPNKSLSAVEAIFFEARLGLMNPGQLYETGMGLPAALE